MFSLPGVVSSPSISQVQLPGGITMNGDQIYNDAKEEIATIQERLCLTMATILLISLVDRYATYKLLFLNNHWFLW